MNISEIIQKTLLIIVICSLTGNAYSQKWLIGPKLNSGAGKMYSGNLKKSFIERKSIDEGIIKWEATSKFGFNFGIGGFAEYSVNDNASVIAELSYNLSKSTINTGYINDAFDINGNGGGDIETIESEAIIKMSYLQLSILRKYNLSGASGLYAIAGFGFNYTGIPKIESSETKTNRTYDNFNIDKTTVDFRTTVAGLNQFNSKVFSFILGAGTVFEIDGRNLFVDIRFNLPLTKSAMYSTDTVYNDIAYENNEVFSFWGKMEAEADAPDYILEDFKMSTITISIGYSLFNKSITQNDERDKI